MGKRREGKRSLHQGKRKQRKRGPQKWPALGVLAAQAGEKEAKAINGKDARGTSKAEDLASARIYVLQGSTCCRRRKGGKSEGGERGKGSECCPTFSRRLTFVLQSEEQASTSGKGIAGKLKTSRLNCQRLENSLQRRKAGFEQENGKRKETIVKTDRGLARLLWMEERRSQSQQIGKRKTR